MKKVIIFLLVVICSFMLFSCKEKEEIKYYNAGTLYDKDGITPLANHQLYLEGTAKGLWTYDAGLVATTITDQNGNFSFVYTQTDFSHFHITSDQGGHLLTHGYVNQNYARDVCIEKKALVTLIVNIERQMNKNDTLFFKGPPPQTELKRIEPFGSSPKVSVYMSPPPKIILKRISHPWNGEGKEMNHIFRYGIGWNDFENCYRSDLLEPYQSIPYTIHGFPFVDTIEVTIK